MGSYDLLIAWKSRWPDDGINSMDSLALKIISRTDHKLYTNVTVDVGLPPNTRPSVDDRQPLFWSDVLLFLSRCYKMWFNLSSFCYLSQGHY